MPYKPKCLDQDKRVMYYTPQNDKFEGYSQFPQPRTAPYYNQTRELSLNPKKKAQIKTFAKEFEVAATGNKTLFEYKGAMKSTIGTSFLSSTINSGRFNTTMDGTKMGRVASPRRHEIRSNTKLRNPSVDDVIASPNALTFNKEINGRALSPPNVTLFTKRMVNVKASEENKANDRHHREIGESNITKVTNINTMRYTHKISNSDVRTKTFQLEPPATHDLYNTLYGTQSHEILDAKMLSTKIAGLGTKTFDKTVKLKTLDGNDFNSKSDVEMNTTKYLYDKMNKYTKEAEGFIVSIPF